MFGHSSFMTTLVLTDPTYTAPASYNLFDRFFLKLIHDKRDLVFIYLILQIFLMMAVGLYLFLPGRFSWWIAVPYLATNWIFFMGPYILMLHCTGHRTLFKNQYRWMNKIVPWVQGPFFGQTPETYFTHHLGMHHPENNLEGDLSSTMHYQRDSFLGFMQYFLTFFFIGLGQLATYFFRKKRIKLMKHSILGELSWIFIVTILCLLNFKATLAVFVIPLCFTRFMMMAGNWGQHAFIDAAHPENCYRNSITCINVSYNQKCFNDGYHIAHHLKPAMHYTDYPVEFLTNQAKYIQEKAIVFKGLDFFMVWVLLMTKSYKTLAKQYVQLDGNALTKEEVIALLKNRTRKIA